MSEKKTPKHVPLPGPEVTPWAYGRYRVVAQRRVSDEETLSVEAYESQLSEARTTLAAFLEDFREHMVAYNDKVVLLHREQLGRIEAMIEERGEECRRLAHEIETLVAQKLTLDHPDTPGAEDLNGEDQ
jgi:hypothetical protein